MAMRKFWLDRKVDPGGISGTGIVAEGVVFSDGRAVVQWLNALRGSIAIYDSLADIQRIHGHGGSTEIILEPQWGKPPT